MNHLGSSNWCGDSDMNTWPGDGDSDDGSALDYLASNIWCTSCNKILNAGRETMNGECDFCVRDRIEATRYRMAQNEDAHQRRLELDR